LLETQLPEVTVEAQAGIRQYADQPELTREITATGLASRRSMSFAVIAQSEGELALNGVRLPWWNVIEQRWEVAELPPRTLRVAPSGEPEVAEPPLVQPQALPAVMPPPASGSPWPLLSAVLALAWLATMALWWRSRRARALPPPMSAAAPAEQAAQRRPTLRKILRDLDSACVVADPTAARGALLAFAETRFTESPPRSLGALAAVLPESVGREVLALEAHIYGVGAGEWRGDALRAVLGELETTLEGEGAGPADPLAPLYR
jgi:hypothetical protein